MKRLLSIISVFLCAALCAFSQNYPYRSDYLWVTVPDHSDWLYETGQDAKVDVQFFRYGMPCDGELEYEIAGDMLPSERRGNTSLKNGHASINMGTRKTPGFQDMRLSLTLDGVQYKHHIKVGYSVDKITPYTKEPSDFMRFWEENISKAEKYPLTYSEQPAPDYCTDKIDCKLVRLQLDSRGSCIYAYLFFPKGAKNGSCPVVLCPPGAGIKTIKEPLRHSYYAENGCIRMEMEIHGLDPRLSEETFKEITAAFNGRDNGYLTNGIENRDRYYMKKVYLSLVRAIDLLTSLPQWDGKNVVVQGGSQGGALSIIAAGLDGRVTHCIANHPALSDMAGYIEEGRTGGYPHLNRIKGLLDNPDVVNTLSYYDVVNFAKHVKAKTLMTWGYNDNTCPPTTSYAVWNSLDCPKESLITPINEHWTSEETERYLCEWMLKNLK